MKEVRFKTGCNDLYIYQVPLHARRRSGNFLPTPEHRLGLRSHPSLWGPKIIKSWNNAYLIFGQAVNLVPAHKFEATMGAASKLQRLNATVSRYCIIYST
jgi:hypothetical protein